MNARVSLLLLAVLACLSLPRIVRADDGTIAVGGEFLFRIRVPATGKTVTERVDQVEERLVPILSEPRIVAADVRLVPVGHLSLPRGHGGKRVAAGPERVRIFVKNHFLIDVTPEDGQANGVSPLEQAQIWAQQLRLILPRINAKPNPNEQGI